jgi:hypothetical protein
MHIRLLLIALTIASSAQAANTTNPNPQTVHVTGTRLGEPMAWRYSLLRTAEDVFKKHEARLAPGATLAFRLPNVNEAQDGNVVEIVTATRRIPLPMVSATEFALPHSLETVDDDAMVVVNRDFPEGSFRQPNVQVRSPGLVEGVKRMGDLRLACAVQVAMAKAQNFKFRAILAAASLFGEICEEMEVTNIGAPIGLYDTVTIEDGDRRMTQPRSQERVPKLGDKSWSDNTRISYRLNGQIVY